MARRNGIIQIECTINCLFKRLPDNIVDTSYLHISLHITIFDRELELS